MDLQIQDIHEVVKNHLKSDDFDVISCEKVAPDGISTGFLSSQGKVRIRFRTSRGETELQVFLKLLPEAAYQRQNILSLGSFRREVILFNEVFNKYHGRLQDNSIPECYLARPDELIVLEDMSNKGFRNKYLHETMDLQHCEKVMETLAKFHALSFITEKIEGRKMTEIVPVINTEVLMSKQENHVGRKASLASMRAMKKIAEVYFTHVPSEVMERALHVYDNIFDELKCSKLYPNILEAMKTDKEFNRRITQVLANFINYFNTDK